MRRFETRTLRDAKRGMPTPFQLVLCTDEGPSRLTCTAVLRHLPGKRLVCSGTRADGVPVVAKLFLDPSGAERHYRRERQGIEALRAAGIPTPDILFQGRLADGQAPVLLVREMCGFADLSERLRRCSAKGRFETLRPVVASIAGLHAAGLRQRDIHPGNFLIAGNQVMVIDGDDIEKPGPVPLSQRHSLSNLALFFAQFQPSFDALVPPLLEVYRTCRNWPPQSLVYHDINAAIQRWRAWRLKRFLPKTRRSCTAFVVRKQWRRFIACDREWYTPVFQPLLNDPDAFIETGTILKAGNSATVARCSVDGQDVVVKRYNIKNRVHALSRSLRPSRAMISWQNAQRLRFIGIATPRPLAVIEERWGWIRRRAYFIMAYLPGETIDRIIRARIDQPLAIAHWFGQLETLLMQLAGARISHGDFKATNFLISSNQLYLVDLDGMQAHRNPAKFKRAFRKDLRRLQLNWRGLREVNHQITGMAERLTDALDMAPQGRQRYP